MSDSKSDLILTKLEAMENENKQEFSAIRQEISNVKEDISIISTKSDAIMEQVVKNSEDITTIKDNQQIIAEIIKRQEDTINILARRSIDQEAKNKRIK